jgi:hypothetical protein
MAQINFTFIQLNTLQTYIPFMNASPEAGSTKAGRKSNQIYSKLVSSKANLKTFKARKYLALN